MLSRPITLRAPSLSPSLWARLHTIPTLDSSMFREGELALLVEPRRHHKPRLVRLESTKHTETRLGRLHHDDIIGREVGVQPRTSLGGRVSVRRPSLEEFTLLMSRGATPSYCSVIYTALCMMDIGGGSKVVEAGTGSGAMTLHLSRIVGAEGRVLSFEVNPGHLEIARRNVERWSKSWNLSQQSKWPDNVSFHCTPIQDAQSCLEVPLVDGVFLDLLHVNSALSVVAGLLQPCRVAVLFLPNITQAVDVDAYIRSSELPLQTEEMVGVCHERWTVKPSRTKRLVTPGNESPDSSEWGSHDSGVNEGGSAGGGGDGVSASLGYICRPSHRQPPHSGFLMKLRRLSHTQRQ